MKCPASGTSSKRAAGREYVRAESSERNLYAAVSLTVKVKGRRPGLNRERRLQPPLEVVAVIAQRRTATGEPLERFEYAGEILACVVARRPVPPQLRDYAVKPTLGRG
jgi:hypothetical protein